MRSRSWVDWERWALETFFLEPGSHGPVECVEVTDEQVMSFAESDDLNFAATAFARGIGSSSLVAGWLSGSTPAPSHGRPFCFRVLVFACWVQVTSLRRSGERVFEDLLAERLGVDAHPGVKGLPSMWKAVQRWLWEEHRIDLRLPPPSSFRWIGYTIKLSFPTWRDLQRLRGIRDAMPLEKCRLSETGGRKDRTIQPGQLDPSLRTKVHGMAACGQDRRPDGRPLGLRSSLDTRRLREGRSL